MESIQSCLLKTIPQRHRRTENDGIESFRHLLSGVRSLTSLRLQFVSGWIR
jgi:hypothetical protein